MFKTLSCKHIKDYNISIGFNIKYEEPNISYTQKFWYALHMLKWL